jgi:hypothetical protein
VSFLADLASGGVTGLLGGIGSLAKDIRTAITGKDPEKEAEIAQKLMELEFAAQQAQTDINVQEAKSASTFVAGWRPAIGWVCALGFFWQFIGSNLMEWVIASFHISITVPALNTGGLMELTLAMLGLGGMRTFEKLKGISGKH